MSKAKRPKVVIQLNYLNSIYTRKKGVGKLQLLIKSWTTGNGETLNPGSTYAKVKLYNTDGVVIDPAKTQAAKFEDELLLGEEKTIATKELMQQVELIIFKRPKIDLLFMTKHQELGRIRLYVAELMLNGKIPAIVERFYQTEFVDKKKESIIKLSLK